MSRAVWTGVTFATLVGLGWSSSPALLPAVTASPEGVATAHAPRPSAADLSETVDQYCVRCHSDRRLTGNLSLEGFRVEAAAEQPETTERMINKLRAAMMPPPGARRPAGDTLLALTETLEDVVDRAAASQPNPGTRRFQRLNRPEYEAAIEDVLGIKVDASNWLPQDMLLANFDNMAVAQTLSSTLLEAYLTAANDVSRLALGHSEAAPTSETYRVPVYQSQHAWDQVDGAPYGTRGGIVVDHHFPASGEYVFDVSLWAGDIARNEDLDISIDGERVDLVELEVLFRYDLGPDWTMQTKPIFIEGGQRRVAVSFIRNVDGPYDDVLEPHDWSLAGTREPVEYGVTLLPHLRDMTIIGPTNPRASSATEARERIFSCRPSVPEEVQPCAEEIVTRLARRAYRRPLTEQDTEGLMSLFESGLGEGGFEIGIRTAIEGILASPHFIFRLEAEPEGLRAGETFDLDDLALASRLSFFLWGSPPDEELVRVADEGRLSGDELERQVRRMLADPRSEALATRFASQWLRLPDLERVRPDAFWFPYFYEQLGQDMRHETELFFEHLVREDRSLFELYEADYTFLNRRLAAHYGIPATLGEDFERVAYPEGMPRKGILGHGSVLMLTSMGNRTSPVLRGKWVMEVLLNTPPPPPPPNVPELDEVGEADGTRMLTTREKLEQHRANPTCNACHRFMDPIGIALENFDVTGRWRLRENGVPVDTQGELYDGTEVSSPVDLMDALLERPVPLVRTFATNLMAYALGRRIEYYDQPTIRAIADEAAQNEYRMSSFILGVVNSDAFQQKVSLGATTDAAQSN